MPWVVRISFDKEKRAVLSDARHFDGSAGQAGTSGFRGIGLGFLISYKTEVGVVVALFTAAVFVDVLFVRETAAIGTSVPLPGHPLPPVIVMAKV